MQVLVPALWVLSTEIRDDVEKSWVGAFWVILKDAHVDVLKVQDQHRSPSQTNHNFICWSYLLTIDTHPLLRFMVTNVNIL